MHTWTTAKTRKNYKKGKKGERGRKKKTKTKWIPHMWHLALPVAFCLFGTHPIAPHTFWKGWHAAAAGNSGFLPFATLVTDHTTVRLLLLSPSYPLDWSLPFGRFAQYFGTLFSVWFKTLFRSADRAMFHEASVAEHCIADPKNLSFLHAWQACTAEWCQEAASHQLGPNRWHGRPPHHCHVPKWSKIT